MPSAAPHTSRPARFTRPWSRAARASATMFWTLLFLVGLELLVRRYWDPRIVGPELYGGAYPGIDYGYALVKPPCLRVDDQYLCFPNEHLPITPHEFPAQKARNELRILTVGSSIGAGTSAFPQQLAYRLRVRCPRLSFTNVNLSAVGFGATRTSVMVEVGQRYEPDLIIMDVPALNEGSDLVAQDQYFREQEGFLGFSSHSQAVIVGRRLVGKFAGKPLAGLGLVPDAPYLDSPLWADPKRFYPREKAAVAKVVAHAKRHAVPLVLVARAQLIPRRSWENEHLEMLKTFEPSAIVVDPDPDFGPHSDRLQYFQKDKLHYSLPAHTIVAKKVATAILEQVEPIHRRCLGQ